MTAPGASRETGVSREKSSGTVQVVEFFLGKQHFAIDLFDIREVVEYTTITSLPNAPPHVRGIIDLRGEITLIVDLRQNLHITETSGMPGENRRIIVLDEAVTRQKTGILVDDVTSVSTFEMDQVHRNPDECEKEGCAGPILGIIKKKVHEKERDLNELIIWTDVKRLLDTITIQT